MVDNRLNKAIKELSNYFYLHSLEELVDFSKKKDQDFINSQVSQSEGGEENDQKFVAKLNNIIVQTQTGALLSSDLINELKLLKSEFGGDDSVLRDNLSIYFDNDAKSVFGVKQTIADVIGGTTLINEEPKRPEKDKTSVSVIQVFTSRINPSNKNTNAVSIFMNAIPTIEWTAAVPYLDIEFNLGRAPIINNRVGQMSPLKFLEGAANVNSLGYADKISASSISISKFESQKGIEPDLERPGSSGIEMFTMPQTLINPEPGTSESIRATPVIDPFRPFASIKSFDVSIVPAPGIMSYKTAKLNFVLHDRSRLHEIADFIKPDQYNKAELIIEYGWSHPATEAEDNVWGNFINALRTKEKYYVKNNSISFTDNGEVDVSLELYTKGSVDFYTKGVYEGADIEQNQTVVKNLQERIAELRNRVFRQDQKFVKEIRGEQILQTAADNNAGINLSPELRKEFKKTISSLGKNGVGDDAKELRQLLIDLYGKNGAGGKAKDLNNSISAAIQKKMQKIVSRSEDKTPDPFLYANDNRDRKEIESNYVSLAKLLLLFVVQPLAATHKFDDIQLLFYNFNDHAGLAQSSNIGSFEIDIKLFQEKYKKVAMSRSGSANLNLRDFIHFIVNNFIEDPSSINYGMRNLYDYEPDKETGSRITPKKRFQDASILNNEIEKIMKKALIPDGVFKMPNVDCYVECVPADPTKVGQDVQNTNQKTILRIHIFDKVSSSYSTYGELLSAQVDEQISTLGDRPFVESGSGDEKSINKAVTESNAIITKALRAKLIEKIEDVGGGNETVYRVKGGPKYVNEFLKNNMPYFLFGANNTAIKKAGFKTMTDNKLSTINMIRAGKAGPLSAAGVGEGGLPMQVMPGQMDLPIFGCPLIEYAQQFFTDFQTGTTVDNIYTVTKIEHSISSGKFDTKLGMVPLDAFGKYRSMIQKVGAAIKILAEYTENPKNQRPKESSEDPDG